ncbi:aminotransferase class I/II-fold pyridoxal phosphate-dependent enzyme [Paenibacillus sp. LHD-117]|uniref:DegT/DnrJ/EryC1/StrS family aminotransferase n=1 Tax=Paenibacillus sp. LHD-117 TaxID=3071412 RepID=UPI0027E07823|nr:aminotransferase class I/II-fold pyridoxal phosphate-dependent enzyme [Paenibacillus sp. LHD-117]MDQ6423267.1 aminotransferase class I/II-fold pyridoxal phosphate-dependent enzyme [Paenibacillus sp. LHD-117]
MSQQHTNEQTRIYLSPPHMSGNEQAYIDEAFRSNWIAPLGPHINAFEQQLSSYVGSRGAAAVSSGTAAIHLALQLLGVGEGDTVICPSFTFVATAGPIRYLGAEPIFVDSEPDTWNLSPAALERALWQSAAAGKLPKAAVVVHLYGGMAKMAEIMDVCGRYGVPVVEDAAESLGSSYRGRQSGTFGAFGIFSFNGNKIITTSGGGMLISDDVEALERAKFLATQARDAAVHYQHSVMGYNYRMSNVLAGIGRAQLEVLEQRVDARRAIYRNYAEALGKLEAIKFMPELEGTRSNRWLTAMTVTDPHAEAVIGSLLESFAEANIEARPLWKPLHLQPLFKGAAFYRHNEQTNSVCEELFRTGICLPSGSGMSKEEQERVIGVIEDVVSGMRAKASGAAS